MEDIKNDKRDRLRIALLDLTPEQLAEFYKWRKVQRDFAYEMDLRFVKKQIEGLHGWENPTASLRYEIGERSDRLLGGEADCDIGIANWCLIHWFNRNRLEAQAEEAIEEDFELNFPVIGSSLYKIVSNDNGETFTDIGVARGYIPHGMRLAKVNPWKNEQEIVEIWY